jgi:hypothetical protein
VLGRLRAAMGPALANLAALLAAEGRPSPARTPELAG